ncbi:Putative bacteriocin (BAGEL) [Oenococcus kitaharae DSM 17330]|uniref:Putative bacteriocin (BAGEL) n=1 Tax=Oenococcus kitaharae DSM 17330 TaxID=1045004 RepID=G9WGH3_9LACO|nr:Putative bacteriocin (BAGEL) [Oenococcus kitaharae DSM 17330]
MIYLQQHIFNSPYRLVANKTSIQGWLTAALTFLRENLTISSAKRATSCESS